MSHIVPDTEYIGHSAAGPKRAAITLPGMVQKIIPALSKDSADVAEILIDGAQDLFREIRIPNRLKDADGKDVVLEHGSKVEITISLRTEKE